MIEDIEARTRMRSDRYPRRAALSFLHVIAFATTLLALSPVPGWAQTFRSGVVYKIESPVAPGKSMEVNAASQANQGSVQIWPYGEGAHQKWKAIDVGGGYWSFAPLHAPAMRLNVRGASSANGTRVTQYPSNGTTAQKFTRHANVDGTYSFEPLCAPGKRIALVNGSAKDGAKLEIRTANATALSQRWKFSALVGDYRPGPETTGPIPGTRLAVWSGDRNATRDGDIIENLDIHGRVNTGTYSKVIVRNCIIRGTAMTGADSITACIISKNEDSRGLLVEDCQIFGRGNPWCSAILTGNYIMRRTEITNVPDGIGLRSVVGNVTVESSWIHNGFYMEWDATTPNRPSQGSHYTHVDGVQFHRGSNYVIRGNMIGGTRFVAKHHSGFEKEIQAADDMFNAALMIKQETGQRDRIPLASEIIHNVLIEKNWLMGGQATINITKGNGNVNDFSTTIIRDNRFIRSTWGSQYYVLRPPNVGVFIDNVFDDDGTPVTISRGL